VRQLRVRTAWTARPPLSVRARVLRGTRRRGGGEGRLVMIAAAQRRRRRFPVTEMHHEIRLCRMYEVPTIVW
jgi:hypothetical protein